MHVLRNWCLNAEYVKSADASRQFCRRLTVNIDGAQIAVGCRRAVPNFCMKPRLVVLYCVKRK